MLTESQTNEIRRLHTAGYSRPLISKKLGIPYNTVWKNTRDLTIMKGYRLAGTTKRRDEL